MKDICNISFLSILTGILEIFLIVHGSFSAIEFVAREQGYFPDKNDKEQEEMYAWLYMCWGAGSCGSKILSGLGLDTIGNWYTRTINLILITIGCTFLYVSSPDHEVYFWLGISMFSLAPGLIFTYYLLINMYPDKRTLLMTCVGSANALAYSFYIGYKRMENPNLFWLLFAIISVLLNFRTFLLTPKSNSVFQYGVDDESKKAIKTVRLGWITRYDDRVIKNATMEQKKKEAESELCDKPDDNDRSTLYKLFRPELISCYLWFWLLDIRSQTLNGELEPWLRWISDNDPEQVSYYTDAFNWAVMTGTITGPIVGFLADWTIKFVEVKFGISHKKSSKITTSWFMIFIALLYTIISLLMAVKTTGAITWVIFILYILVRNILYGCRGTYVMVNTDKSIVGRCLSFLSFLQLCNVAVPRFFTWVVNTPTFDGNYGYVNLLVAGLTFFGGLVMVKPLFIFYREGDEIQKVLGEANKAIASE